MSGFRFSLQRLLDLRHAAERAQAAATGRANQEVELRRAASDERATELETIAREATSEHAVPAGLRRAFGLSTDAARHRLESADDALREAEAIRSEAQHKLTDALAARRTLERLRERREADWWVEQGRQDRAQDDEVARQLRSQEGEES